MTVLTRHPLRFVNSFWLPVWFRFGLVAFLALMAGFLLGERWGYLTAIAGLGTLIGFHLHYLRRVNDWLIDTRADGTPVELPTGFGAWESVFFELRRARKRDQRHTNEVEETLARFMEASSALPDGIIILDMADRIEWCNPSACRHFGLDLARDRSFLIANLVRQPAFTEYLVRADFREPLSLADPSGTLALTVQFLPFQRTRRIILSRDVTALIRVEAMRRDFVANVSHELRTPLTVVGGFLEQLEDQPEIPAAQRSRIHSLMIDQSHRMQRLIEDLITLSRLESQGAPSMEESICARILMGQLLDEAGALSKGRHVIETAIDESLILAGAAEELRSAFSNLISNAVRYTPAGGSVRVALAATEGGAAFSVTDTGPGIAAEHIPRLTERFYRVDKSRSRETGGTGLGLAIVKHILARHGGRLDIDSTVGKGSRFTAVLPATRVQHTPPPG